MGCSGCSTKTGGKPNGCRSNGGCSSGGCNRMNAYDWLHNLPLVDDACRVVEVSFSHNEALEGILEVAKESQHPRAYEVAANMIKNLSDVTEKLMILQKQQQDLKPKEVAPTNITVDKAVFVGSTTDLLKKLKNESSD